MQEVQATFATARVNRLIGRSFSVAALLLSVESGFNFYGQLGVQNDSLAWTVISGLWLTTLAFTCSYWFGRGNQLYFQIHALYMIVLLVAWPFLVNESISSSGNFYPWLWWAMGTGWFAAAISFKLRWAVAYFAVLISVEQIIFTSPVGGSHSEIQAVIDGIYTFLTNGTAATVALFVRRAAIESDRANSEVIQAAIKQAEVEAKNKERQRLDALVHDSVLTAFISASNAKSPEEAKAAAELSADAISKLADIQENKFEEYSIFCGDLFDTIIDAAKQLDSKIQSSKKCGSQVAIERTVASALTQATIQAVQNSVIHAGRKAKREILLKSTLNEIKIVVKDDGVGFRPKRSGKGRLGIQVSIVGRVEAVGGVAHIVSAPRKGTTVILEWSRK